MLGDINNLRYADDTTLMAESEEELKKLLMKSESDVAQSCSAQRPLGLQPTRLLHPWDFSRQENWSGLPFPSPGHLPDPGMEPGAPARQVDTLLSESPQKCVPTLPCSEPF